MGLEYVNRRGDRYFVLQGVTKTGKPKYYCSTKPRGKAVEQLPAGYEIHEDPARALVTVRKVRPSPILAAERQLLERMLAEIEVAGLVDVDGDSLVVYTCDADAEGMVDRFAQLGALRISRPEAVNLFRRQANYTAMLRFRLSRPEDRPYSADRWCFRGSIDNWTSPTAGNARPQVPAARRKRELLRADVEQTPHSSRHAPCVTKCGSRPATARFHLAERDEYTHARTFSSNSAWPSLLPGFLEKIFAEADSRVGVSASAVRMEMFQPVGRVPWAREMMP